MHVTVHAGINILGYLAESLDKTVEQALDHGVITALEVADGHTPVDTGALRSNISVNKSAGQREIVWNQHYAIYQEFGTSRGVPANLFATQGADAATEVVNGLLAGWGR